MIVPLKQRQEMAQSWLKIPQPNPPYMFRLQMSKDNALDKDTVLLECLTGDDKIIARIYFFDTDVRTWITTRLIEPKTDKYDGLKARDVFDWIEAQMKVDDPRQAKPRLRETQGSVMIPCFLCGEPSDRGFHYGCIDRSSRHDSASIVEACEKPCKNCPFRKDKPNWMDEGRILLNVARLELGVIQTCHKAIHKRCAGAMTAASGGSDSIYSIDELKRLDPCPTDEMLQQIERGNG